VGDALLVVADVLELGELGAEGGAADSGLGHHGPLPVSHAVADVRVDVVGDHGVGVGVHACAEQVAHLLLGHLLALQADQVDTTADPAARRVALRCVVRRRLAASLAGRVAVGDVPGEVGVAAPGCDLGQAYHELSRRSVL
jgi:hypothetical protein